MEVAQVSNTNGMLVRKTDQSEVKGLLWGVAGFNLIGVPLTFTALAAMAIGGTVLATTSTTALENKVAIALATGAVITLDYLALKAVGRCFANAFYHFGPEYKVEQDPKNAFFKV